MRPPKYLSERTIYLPDELVDLLALHVRDHRPGTDPSRWLFEVTDGQPPHQNTVGYQWRATCLRAGVEGLTLHDLRHFYASGLIAAGCDVVTVQRALGHANAMTTLNTYADLWPTAEDRTRAAAGGLLKAVLRAPRRPLDLPRDRERPAEEVDVADLRARCLPEPQAGERAESDQRPEPRRGRLHDRGDCCEVGSTVAASARRARGRPRGGLSHRSPLPMGRSRGRRHRARRAVRTC